VAGGCGDDDLVRPDAESAVHQLEVPAGHFADEVAAFAGAAAVLPDGGSAVGVAGDVVDVSDGCVAVGVAAGLVAEPDSWLSQPSK
jgi:hypothetical protein